MATDDQEEYEQGEQLRQWLRANGGSMIGGVAVGLLLIAGWQWWQHKQELQAEDASTAYSRLTTAISSGSNEKNLDAMEHAFRSDYAKSSYAAFAALRIAAHQVDRNDPKSALVTLDSIGSISEDPALATLVQLRAARVLLIMGKPSDALARIAPIKDPAYTAVTEEIRGDGERALNHFEAARAAYAKALENLPADAPDRGLLQMKLADVGGVIPKTEARKA